GVTVDATREEDGNEQDFPYLRVANVQSGGLDLSEIKNIRISPEMAARSMLHNGDVVMTEANGNTDNLGRGTVWRNQITRMVHQNHIFAIRTPEHKLLPDYLSIVLSSIHGRRYFSFTSTQVGIATTTGSKVLSLPLPVASLRTQQHIVDECSQLRESTDACEHAIKRQLDVLTERRQALITAAITGQFDVTTA